MKKIIDSIKQVISIWGNDFTKWPNKMAPDVLKATYEMLKEYHEQLNRHGSFGCKFEFALIIAVLIVVSSLFLNLPKLRLGIKEFKV